MCSAARGDTGLKELRASHAHTQAASSPPGPAPGAREGTITTWELRQMGNGKDLPE